MFSTMSSEQLQVLIDLSDASEALGELTYGHMAEIEEEIPTYITEAIRDLKIDMEDMIIKLDMMRSLIIGEWVNWKRVKQYAIQTIEERCERLHED